MASLFQKLFYTYVSPTTVAKVAGPRLVPFIKAVIIFFVLYPVAPDALLTCAFFKCLPIFCLIGLLFSHNKQICTTADDEFNELNRGGFATSVFNYCKSMLLSPSNSYARSIAIGLLFSSVGDALLVYPDYFNHGICAFAVAQICYTVAFGFAKLRLTLGLLCYGFTIGLYSIGALTLKENTFIIVLGLVYALLICTMFWRAAARVQFQLDSPPNKWTELSSFIGAVIFVISDSAIIISEYFITDMNAHPFIMATYYFAQMSITLSVLDDLQDKPTV
jgi:alkenylglycerophosphocholine/alkenylglycerophosphoethanolamine hydrolase